MKYTNTIVLITFTISCLTFTSQAETDFSGIYKGKANIYHNGWIDLNKNGTKDPYEDSTLNIEFRIDDLLAHMTVAEKSCQMCTLYGYQRVLRDALPNKSWKNKIWKDGIGAIDEHLNGFRGWGHPPQDNPYIWPASKHAWAINEVQRFFIEETRLGIPVDFTNEGIRGIEAFKASNFPTQLAIGQTWNKSLVKKIGQITGREARLLGYSNVYSPILDIGRDQRWGRYEEVYGESPYLVAELGIAMTKGLQHNNQVAATAKHYCLYSNNKGAREGYSRVDPQFAPREGENIHLYTFRRVIKEAGLMGVMSSYNDYDGVPIQGSHYWLTERLRDDFGFNGYVVSDSDAVIYMNNKHKTTANYKESVYKSVMAGLNMRCTFRSPDSFINPLRELIQNKKIPLSQIDNMVRDILRVKFTTRLFDSPYVEDLSQADREVYSKSNQAVALQASRESLVLLKNKSKTLPLKRSSIKQIAVIGPNADDGRYATAHYGPVGVEVSTALNGITKLAGSKINVVYAKGCHLTGRNWPDSELIALSPNAKEQTEINKAVKIATASDVVIAVVGGNTTTCGENKSRTSLNLPGLQRDLLKALHATRKPLIVVVISGRPLSINWCDRNADAIIQAFYPGAEGGRAIAETIFGDINPGGKLSISVPKTAGQIPMNFPCKPASQVAAGSAGVNGMLYPFGHGLSYTTFDYSNLAFEPLAIKPDGNITISFDVTNTGKRPGDEIAQLYLRDLVSSVTTYEKNLRGFDRIHLTPGETKRLSYTLTPDDMQLLNEKMQWVVEPGKFKIMIGSSSTKIQLENTFLVAATDKEVTTETHRLTKNNNAKNRAAKRLSIINSIVQVSDNHADKPNAFDGNLETWWSSAEKHAEMVLSMQDGAAPDNVKIAWYKGNQRKYNFEIQRNAGGGQWVTVYKGQSSGKTNNFETYNFKPDGASEIKLIFNGNDQNKYSAITKITIPGLPNF